MECGLAPNKSRIVAGPGNDPGQRPYEDQPGTCPACHWFLLQFVPDMLSIVRLQTNKLRLANIHRLTCPVRRLHEDEGQADGFDLERHSGIGSAELHLDRFVGGNRGITAPHERRELIDHIERGDEVSAVQIFRGHNRGQLRQASVGTSCLHDQRKGKSKKASANRIVRTSSFLRVESTPSCTDTPFELLWSTSMTRRACRRFTQFELPSISDTGGSRTHTHEGLSFIAIPSLRTVPRVTLTTHWCRAAGAELPAGFRGFAKTLVPRPLPILPSERQIKRRQQTSLARVGLEPTASLVLSRSGLPLPTKPKVIDPGWTRTIVCWL